MTLYYLNKVPRAARGGRTKKKIQEKKKKKQQQPGSWPCLESQQLLGYRAISSWLALGFGVGG